MPNDTPLVTSSKTALDRRTNVFRADLAASHLRKKIDVPNYAEGRLARVTAACATLHKGPDYDTPAETQLIFGDDVTVYDEIGNWAWVQNNRDGYVGYLPKGCLSSDMRQPTHKVTAISTFAYGQPNLKTPLPYKLFMNSRLRVVKQIEDYLQLDDGRFVHRRHVGALDEVADDFVTVAERYMGVPYLWGGRTSDGIDCSGLVQVAYEAAGLAAPRDADMQMSMEGREIDLGSMEDLERGDLVFWPGHVAIMVDDIMLLHANARDMAVSVEPFFAAVTRIAYRGDGDVLAVRRPVALSAGEIED